MLVVMDHKATQAEIDAVVAAIEAKGCTARPIPGGHRVAICVLHNQGPVEPNLFLSMPGVKEAIPVTHPYKLVSRESQPDDTVIQVGPVAIGNGHLTIIAGPCAIESEAQALTIARYVKRCRSGDLPGRRFQTQDLSLRLPGSGRRRVGNLGAGEGRNRYARGHRSHGP